MPLRVRVRLGARVELHERAQADVLVGSGRDADLRVAHPQVAPLHLRLSERRGRVIASDLGQARRGTVIDGRRADAPVVLSPGSILELGELQLEAEAVAREALGPVGRQIGHERLKSERPSSGGARRFLLVRDGGDASETTTRELVWPAAEADIEAWRTRVGPAARTHHSGRIEAWVTVANRVGLVESMPAGIRLDAWLAAHGDRVAVPLAARGLVVAHLAQALGERHARGLRHGAVGPELVQLGRRGAAVLLAPGPREEPLDLDRARAARRYGEGPALEDDVWSLVRLAGERLGLDEVPAVLELLRGWAGRGVEIRPLDVIEALRAEGVDPAPSALARSVRVAEALDPGPLVTSRDP